MTTWLVPIAFMTLALAVTLVIGIGLYRSRHHIRWKNPGYNIFTGTWSDEPDDDEHRKR